MQMEDTYKTIATSLKEEVLFKEKKSKFYGYSFPIQNEDEVKPLIESLKKKHHTANHVCYAWQLGTDRIRYRANDDGEPNNSAGMPIYGQLQSFGVTNVLVAVARVFGGTKLGVGGLISAYRTTAQMTLEASPIIEKIVQQHFVLFFDYASMNVVMRAIKQHQINIIAQQLDTECRYEIAIRKSKVDTIATIFGKMQNVKIQEI
ncbi:IMPACT family protein [Spongiimicrobium salis]|uniref:IMPACT family protein n=1 Tax=Spongiimicrobium salis TaxID=1667022 RepID=UPI00374D20E4